MQLVDWGFSHYQMDEIIKGLQSGVDVSIYADPKCSIIQMSLIRHRLEDVSKKSQYDFYPAQKEIIRNVIRPGIFFTLQVIDILKIFWKTFGSGFQKVFSHNRKIFFAFFFA